MKKPLFLALAAVATAFVATAAHAGGQVYWSIGVNAPPLSTVISNGPVYGSGYGGSYGGGYGGGYGAGYGPGPAVTYVPAPVYVPAPPLWRPPPVYQVVPRVVYLPPVQIGYGGRWYQPEPQRWQGHDRDRDRDHGRGRDRDRDLSASGSPFRALFRFDQLQTWTEDNERRHPPRLTQGQSRTPKPG